MADHKCFIEAWDSLDSELLVIMAEMDYGSQYKHKDHITAIMFIDAQLKKINSQGTFAMEQDWLEMPVKKISQAARVEYGEGKKLDLELLSS